VRQCAPTLGDPARPGDRDRLTVRWRSHPVRLRHRNGAPDRRLRAPRHAEQRRATRTRVPGRRPVGLCWPSCDRPGKGLSAHPRRDMASTADVARRPRWTSPCRIMPCRIAG